ncbi:putative ATP synthase subunit J [Clavispora lusitaniae]|uniref:ATP synthase subunit J n=1 Tax=Clavispora lusitaniae TaxID=36911 RepID=A0ACD0WN23_CLALS|nr:putative ATP synthase subunit J [Clavispora lusitaniae]QFZ34186.1 putative ATP synthase subunit J [Clavispora lusitaniae]QFZ39870.1 putative ATP synthase subunit J [Clavispora lusitaniae]QFZ45552.1 putative ATP synthase subunit J [Clavispora lusitaniae]QFZ51216.1 putative ATP synthase subunit J [Clavispora lusitaniae]
MESKENVGEPSLVYPRSDDDSRVNKTLLREYVVYDEREKVKKILQQYLIEVFARVTRPTDEKDNLLVHMAYFSFRKEPHADDNR